MEYIFGSLAYVFYFIYDYNSIHKKNKILKSFFLIGTILLTGSTVYATIKSFRFTNLALVISSASIAFVFLILLIYTLFFAIPFDETYLKDNSLRDAYTKGVYSICRHPGMLWFLGLYIALWLMTGNWIEGIFYGLMILGDLLYIIYQDYYIFPKTFSNYSLYKKQTPFLIPGLHRRARKYEDK